MSKKPILSQEKWYELWFYERPSSTPFKERFMDKQESIDRLNALSSFFWLIEQFSFTKTTDKDGEKIDRTKWSNPRLP